MLVGLLMAGHTQYVYASDMLDWLHEAGEQMHGHAEDSDRGDQARLLTLEPGEYEMYPVVSADERSMLTVSGKRHHQWISLRSVENGDPLAVAADFDGQVMDSVRWHGNDQLTFLSYRQDSLALWQMPDDGSGVRRLNRRLDGELRAPLLLPDDSLLAVRLTKHSRLTKAKKTVQATFNNWEHKGYQSRIAHLTAQGAERELAEGANPALSPDGDRIVFSMKQGHDWHLFMMNVDGSELVQLTEGKHADVQPAWSRDGKWIVFVSNRKPDADQHAGKENWDIWLIGRDGRDLMRITTHEALDGAPEIANGRVYFHSNRPVGKSLRKARGYRGQAKGFHIWVIELPAKVS